MSHLTLLQVVSLSVSACLACFPSAPPSGPPEPPGPPPGPPASPDVLDCECGKANITTRIVGGEGAERDSRLPDREFE